MSERRRDSVGPRPKVDIDRSSTHQAIHRVDMGSVKHLGANRVMVESFENLGAGTALSIQPVIDTASPEYFSCRGQVVRSQELEEDGEVRWVLDVVLDPFPVKFINSLDKYFDTFGDKNRLVPPGSIVGEIILDSTTPAQRLRPSIEPTDQSGRYGFVDKGFARKRQSKPPKK